MNERDIDVIRFVMQKNVIRLRDLEDYISQKYGIGIKASYSIIKRLIDKEIFKVSRTNRTIFIEPHPKFLRLIVEFYSYISPERARYLKR